MLFVYHIIDLSLEGSVLEQIRVYNRSFFDVMSAVDLNRTEKVELVIMHEIGKLTDIRIQDLIELCLNLAERNEVFGLGKL